MLKEILNNKTCARCQICCLFDSSDIWEMPLITPELSERIAKDYPEIKMKPVSEKAQCKVFDADYGKDGLAHCPMLTEKGCALGDEKPFDCRIWPFRLMKKGNLLLLTLSPVCPSVSGLPVDKISEFAQKIIPDILAEANRNPEMIKPYEAGYPVFWVGE